jgi:hypothetical protein
VGDVAAALGILMSDLSTTDKPAGLSVEELGNRVRD